MPTQTRVQSEVARFTVSGLWMALVALVAFGVLAVVLRVRAPDDAATRLESVRQTMLTFLHGQGASPSRIAEVAQFDARFRDHPAMTLGHILAGGAFLILLPMQLARPVRER